MRNYSKQREEKIKNAGKRINSGIPIENKYTIHLSRPTESNIAESEKQSKKPLNAEIKRTGIYPKGKKAQIKHRKEIINETKNERKKARKKTFSPR